MNQDKYERLFRAHYRAMYRYAYTIMHDADDARDVVSDVWTRLLQTDGEIKEDTAEVYLKRLVHNQCINYLQHKKVEGKAQILLSQELEPEQSDDDIIERERQWSEIGEYIQQSLSPRTQEILKLRYRDELSYREMAEQLNVSTSAINKHLTEALSRLRKLFIK